MDYEKTNLKDGITVHKITTSKFKTNLFAIFLTTPLNRENVTKNALISAVLRRGTMNYASQDIIAKELEDMYGASFDCGIDKNVKTEWTNGYVMTLCDECRKKELENLENDLFKETYDEFQEKRIQEVYPLKKEGIVRRW